MGLVGEVFEVDPELQPERVDRRRHGLEVDNGRKNIKSTRYRPSLSTGRRRQHPASQYRHVHLAQPSQHGENRAQECRTWALSSRIDSWAQHLSPPSYVSMKQMSFLERINERKKEIKKERKGERKMHPHPPNKEHDQHVFPARLCCYIVSRGRRGIHHRAKPSSAN